MASNAPQLRVLFVCLGNICRSPTAEGIFRKLVGEAGLQAHFEIDSAGSLDFQVGKAPDPRAQKEARSHGVALGELRARVVCAADYERFDYLVAMDRMNLAELERGCPPACRGRLSLMLSHGTVGGLAEVPDPYSGEVGFAHVWRLLEQASIGLLQAVRAEHGL